MKMVAALKTFLVFFVSGVALGTAMATVVLIFDAIWTDCFAGIPGTPVCGDGVLVALTLWVPAVGTTMGIAFVPLLAGAVLAAVGRRLLDRIPLWYAAAILPLCLLAYLAVGAPWLQETPLAYRLVLVAAFEAAALLLGWWLDGRHTDRLPAITWLDPADAGKP